MRHKNTTPTTSAELVADEKVAKPTWKMRAALERLAQKFHSGFARGAQILVLLDVLRFVCDRNPIPALIGVMSLRSVRGSIVRRHDSKDFLAYTRARWFEFVDASAKLCVSSGRTAPWLPRFRITYYPADRTGVLPKHVFEVLEVVPGARLNLVELAVDASLASRFDRAFVPRHGLFGKSQRAKATFDGTCDRWGARRSGKTVKSYAKDDVAAHRVELQLRSTFLRTYGIDSVFDFQRLAELLPGRQIFFGEFIDEKLVELLRRRGRDAEEIVRVLKQVVAREHDLLATLKYLRTDVGIQNARRLLKPLPENAMVKKALKTWAASWPAAPAKKIQ